MNDDAFVSNFVKAILVAWKIHPNLTLVEFGKVGGVCEMIVRLTFFTFNPLVELTHETQSWIKIV